VPRALAHRIRSRCRRSRAWHGSGHSGHRVVRSNLICVTRHCDTVQSPIVREHLLVLVSMKSVWSLGLNQFYLPTCVHLAYPQRAQTISITALPFSCLITLGSEDGPQGGRGGSTWVQETFDSLKERESRLEGNGGGATLRSMAASNWTQAGPAGNSQRPSNLHFICKNSSLNEGYAGERQRSAGR